MNTDEKEESSTLPGKLRKMTLQNQLTKRRSWLLHHYQSLNINSLKIRTPHPKKGKEKEQQSISSKAVGAGKSFKDLITSAGGKVTSSEVSQPLASVVKLEYSRILRTS